MVTTAPALTMAYFPIVTPGYIMAPVPIQQSSFKVILPYFHGINSVTFALLAPDTKIQVTRGAIETLSPTKTPMPFALVSDIN